MIWERSTVTTVIYRLSCLIAYGLLFGTVADMRAESSCEDETGGGSIVRTSWTADTWGPGCAVGLPAFKTENRPPPNQCQSTFLYPKLTKLYATTYTGPNGGYNAYSFTQIWDASSTPDCTANVYSFVTWKSISIPVGGTAIYDSGAFAYKCDRGFPGPGEYLMPDTCGLSLTELECSAFTLPRWNHIYKKDGTPVDGYNTWAHDAFLDEGAFIAPGFYRPSDSEHNPQEHPTAFEIDEGNRRECTVSAWVESCGGGRYQVIMHYRKEPMESSLGGGLSSYMTQTITLGSGGKQKVSFQLPVSRCYVSAFAFFELRKLGNGCDEIPPPPASPKDDLQSVSSWTGIGQTEYGVSAGGLLVKEPTLHAGVFSRSVLKLVGTTAAVGTGIGMEIFSDEAGFRQIRTGNALVDIVQQGTASTPEGFELRFYQPSEVPDVNLRGTGYDPIPVGLQPFAIVRYIRETTTAGDALRVERQSAGAAPLIRRFYSTAPGALALELLDPGVGSQSGSKIILNESRNGTERTVRKEFWRIGAAQPDRITVREYIDYPFGEVLVRSQEGEGAGAVVEESVYDETKFLTGNVINPNYGNRVLVSRSDGTWSRYTYNEDGRVAAEIYPASNAPSSESNEANLRVIRFTRQVLTGEDSPFGPGELETREESVRGVLVARSHEFLARDPVVQTFGTTSTELEHRVIVRCTSLSAELNWYDSAHEVEHEFRTRIFQGMPIGADVLVTVRGDGTASIRYDQLVGLGRRVVTMSGLASLSADGRPPVTISAGKVTEQEFNGLGYPVSFVTRDVASNLVLQSDLYSVPDWAGRPTRVDHLDGSYEIRSYSLCCGKLESVQAQGLLTSFGYDSRGRLTSRQLVQDSMGGAVLNSERFVVDAAGAVIERYTVPTDGSGERCIEKSGYDTAGRLVSTSVRAPVGSGSGQPWLTTTYQEGTTSSGHYGRTSYRPGSGVEVELRDASGAVVERSGTAVSPARFEQTLAVLPSASQWGFPAGASVRVTREVMLDASGAPTEQSQESFLDALGRVILVRYSDGATEERFYGADDQLSRIRRPAREAGDGQSQTLFSQDALGRTRTTVVDMNGNGTIDWSGPDSDRITRTSTGYRLRPEGESGVPVEWTRTEVWASADDSPATITLSERALDGSAEWLDNGGVVTEVRVSTGADGVQTRTTVRAERTETTRSLAGRVIEETVTAPSAAGSSQTVQMYHATHTYDRWGRRQSTTVDGSGSTVWTYDSNNDQVASVCTPDPDPSGSGPGRDPQVTSYRYDQATGLLATTVRPDSGEVHRSYHANGKLWRTWGAGTYPQEYVYDTQGRMVSLSTWREFEDATSFASAVGRATTIWVYDPKRGWLSEKRYADGKGVSYAYYADGLLRTRTWARSVGSPAAAVTTNYSYDAAGKLEAVGYSDGTPAASYAYDRLGRVSVRTDAAGVATLGYQGLSTQVTSEVYSGAGALSGVTLSRGFDSELRLTRVSASGAAERSWHYDAQGRTGTLDSTYGGTSWQAQYTYADVAFPTRWTQANRSLGAGPGVATNRVFDKVGRVVSWSTGPYGSQYGYNDVGQRTRDSRANGSNWDYFYDELDQLEQGELTAGTDAVDFDTGFNYDFDSIGNRISTVADGFVAAWTANYLNQVQSRSVAPRIEVRGTAVPEAKVLVDGAIATRSGQRWNRTVDVVNGATNVRKAVRVVAALPGAGPGQPDVISERTETVEVAKHPEVFAYDFDGNLTQDGKWTYSWDAENRLVAIEPSPASLSAGAPRERITYEYDGLSRRIRRTVSIWGGVNWDLRSDIRYLYDGWNPIAEYVPTATGLYAFRSYVWGPDMSETAQGAGGVSGLLATFIHTSWIAANDPVTGAPYEEPRLVQISSLERTRADLPALVGASPTRSDGEGAFLPCYDGNGNVLAYLDAGNGSPVATQTYGPFGERLSATGFPAKLLPHRWSTKPEEERAGLSYYGYRYYSASLGRWLSRDPLGERGGLNLYGMVGNSAVNRWDVLGLYVKIVYDVEGKTLTATDVDTGKTLTLKKVYSGNGVSCCKKEDQWKQNEGPLPTGTYLVGRGYDSGHGGDDWWYKLYGSNGSGGYSYNDIPVTDPDGNVHYRGGFNLHTGRASDGCVTVWSDVSNGEEGYPKSDDYNKLKDMLNNTKPLEYKGYKYSGSLEVK